MNSLERILGAVHFHPPQRVPVIAQVFGHAAVLEKIGLDAYLRNGELLARCQLRALEHYGYDAVFALMDVGVETEALGSVLSYSPFRYPAVTSYAFAKGIPEIPVVPDPDHAGRMPELLKTAKILRKEVGNQILVVGCVLGPMTLAIQLMGPESALFLGVDDPEKFSLLLDFAADVAIRFGVRQLEAGVHLLMIFEPSASPDVIPPALYREFVLPRQQRIFRAFKQAGSLANWLHTAGPVLRILPYYPQAGVDIANIDYCVDPAEAMRILPTTCLNGNIRPTSFVVSDPETIAAESAHLLKLFEKPGGFILSSGCEIPPESKPENIAAMVGAIRKGG